MEPTLCQKLPDQMNKGLGKTVIGCPWKFQHFITIVGQYLSSVQYITFVTESWVTGKLNNITDRGEGLVR